MRDNTGGFTRERRTIRQSRMRNWETGNKDVEELSSFPSAHGQRESFIVRWPLCPVLSLPLSLHCRSHPAQACHPPLDIGACLFSHNIMLSNTHFWHHHLGSCLATRLICLIKGLPVVPHEGGLLYGAHYLAGEARR